MTNALRIHKLYNHTKQLKLNTGYLMHIVQLVYTKVLLVLHFPAHTDKRKCICTHGVRTHDIRNINNTDN